MSSATPPAGTSPRKLIAVIVLVPVIVALALWAFAWPASRTAPRDLPLGVAGPATAVSQVEQQLSQREGAFEIHRYADEAAARDAIEDRTVYGAIVVTEQGPKLLTATAASPLVAQLLQQAATAGAPQGTQVPTADVVAAPAEDPRGGVLNASVLPLAIAGVAAGALVTVMGLRGGRAVVALVGAATLVGIVAAALAHSWLGALSGDWWTEAGALALSTLAVSAAVAGFAALIGPAGIGIGALLVVLIGNPFSGVASAPELLPQPAGVIGQLLPPGAGGSLLRSVSFFDGAAATGPAITLAVWALAGLALVLIGARRRTAPAGNSPAPANAPQPAPVG
ncbi:ABC transporter permease [Streptomyces sp. TRM66268-LWL]|uniref:ABC transporter permease n=1 Tax=Streptomyces polyasparticus TaxID=2767826 RepID=A0ABR7SIX5_9ACTN|nr:ABC transporter permease [Streptomyces polyasparticus]MBC9714932.1 ABC transporter permease [Streptomyces polyasparticus]